MKKRLLLLLLASITLIAGCGKQQVTNDAAKQCNAPKITKEVVKEPTYLSPYTGEKVDKATYSKLSFMVIVENSKPARPQAGLNNADIVYETMAEGGIPRFIALYQKNDSKKIGPVRSARPYFLDITKEYNLPFAHCGGSEEALESIIKEKLMSMNEMKYGKYYWRDRKRVAPHNLYTCSDNLQRLIKNNKIEYDPLNKPTFNSTFWNNPNLNSANSIYMKLNRFYNTSYVFKNNLYLKSMDKEPATDSIDNSQLNVKNVVIQITNIKLQSDGKHLSIKLLGSGTAYVISNGKYIKGTWVKQSSKDKTIFKDEKGNEIPLSPGKTWWHIVDTNCNISIK